MKTLILFLCLILSSCSTEKFIFKKERFDQFESFTLSKAISFEQRIKSLDVTPSHHIRIGKDIYPNVKDYKLETPKTFQSLDEIFELDVEYFYSPHDESVKVILYEWYDQSPSKFSNSDIYLKSARYSQKYEELKLKLTRKLGAPTFEEINSSLDRPSFRDGAKWEDGDKVKAYLFLIGNDHGFRMLRLAIYALFMKSI